jgi:hypothetical protein
MLIILGSKYNHIMFKISYFTKTLDYCKFAKLAERYDYITASICAPFLFPHPSHERFLLCVHEHNLHKPALGCDEGIVCLAHLFKTRERVLKFVNTVCKEVHF